MDDGFEPEPRRPSTDTLETQRLLLRRWTLADIEPLAEIYAKREVWEYPRHRGLTHEETEAFVRKQLDHWERFGFNHFAACDRESGRLLGMIGIGYPLFLPDALPHPEIGWRLDPAVWGQGLATEGALATLAWAFDDLGFDRVVSIYEPENEASGRVMQRIGMTFERETTIPAHGARVHVYALDRAGWTP